MRNKTIRLLILGYAAILTLGACGDKKPPLDLSSPKPTVSTTEPIRVEYREMNGVKAIPVKINGVSMDVIYDSGCSGISLSAHEVKTLVKNGCIDEADVEGLDYSVIADGSVMENLVVNLRKIEIGQGDRKLTLHNKRATVVLNSDAPVLLGNAVFDEVARVEADNDNHTINFYPR